MVGHYYILDKIIATEELVRMSENVQATGAGNPHEAEVQRWMELFEYEARHLKSILWC
jgi:hypothetical protein